MNSVWGDLLCDRGPDGVLGTPGEPLRKAARPGSLAQPREKGFEPEDWRLRLPLAQLSRPGCEQPDEVGGGGERIRDLVTVEGRQSRADLAVDEGDQQRAGRQLLRVECGDALERSEVGGKRPMDRHLIRNVRHIAAHRSYNGLQMRDCNV